MVWGTSVNLLMLIQLICCFPSSWFSGKSTRVGSLPNFPKLISQLWEIPQPQYFITLLLDLHWTYFWKHYIYYKKDTKVGNFGYQIWFCTRLQTDCVKQKFHKLLSAHINQLKNLMNLLEILHRPHLTDCRSHVQNFRRIPQQWSYG